MIGQMHGLSRPRLSGAATATIFALWAVALLLPHPGPAQVVVPVGFALGGWLVRRHAVAGALIVCATQAIGLALGAPDLNASGLVPGICSVYLVGRDSRSTRGIAVLVGFIAVIAMTELEVVRVLIGVLLFTATWLVGQLAADGAGHVRAREQVASALETRDLDEQTALMVDHERERLLASSLDVVESAVLAMRRDALAALDSLDPELLDRVENRGEEAIVDLRRILGILRTPRDRPDPEPSGAAPSRRRLALTDALVATALMGVGAAEAAASSLGSEAIALSAAGPVGIVVWRRKPAAAALLCSVAPAVALGRGVVLPHGLAEMITIGLVAWSATIWITRPRGAGARVAVALLAALVPIASAVALHHSTLSLVPIAVAVVCGGAAWLAISANSATRQVEDRIAVAQRLVEVSAEDALRVERRRIARELHDITSHAVAAMMMQTRVARALATTDRESAHVAMARVLEAADLATNELATLTGMTAAHTPLEPEGLPVLIDRLSATGLQIDLTGNLPEAPDLALTVHRVVQESVTNALRHAPGAHVRVAVLDLPDAITVDITDEGGRAPGPGSGCGYGLQGLSERVRLHGGTLSATPTDSGFHVAARLPKAIRHVEETRLRGLTTGGAR